MQKKNGVRRSRLRKTGKRPALGAREKRRLIQLGLCIGLFLVVFVGRGALPGRMEETGAALLQAIRTDADFKGAFVNLGEAVSQGEPVLATLGSLAAEVFGAGGQAAEEEPWIEYPDGPSAQAGKLALTTLPTQQSILAQLGVSIAEEETLPDEEPLEQPPAQEPSPVPQVPAYTGPELPEGATMDYMDLGLSDTVTPVLGVVSSEYGYRYHPISGEYSFHSGADVAADTGTPVQAFAAGTVDFIGESEAYGLYIQLNHGNGVTSFYCHCSELFAQKGETVSKGQVIAAVGATGNATGPHLHLELKQDGTLLNPLYYIETAE